MFSYINVELCRERGKEGKRERGKEGKRERGNEGKRERGKEVEKVMAFSRLRMPHYSWLCELHQSSLL